ncbi:MAG: hypothetical protein KF766_04250 [Rhodocyclaceae bacterium]|nr:hypothetical protein [Rhodocyclaceae bacterium]MCB1891377.1 hypothetical protein [Rhodocyclaceae bacterium]MCP5297307.1 hypothetical protein [Zoogloeaceae bacterium]
MHKSILKLLTPPAVLALLILTAAAASQDLVPNAMAGASAKGMVDLPAQKSAVGGVTIKIKPLDLSSEAKEWVFEVVLETHTQDLGDDLAKTAALIDSAGRQAAPTKWQGDGPGGHHRKGQLHFAPLSPQPASVELHIRRTGEAAPRTFAWKLK